MDGVWNSQSLLSFPPLVLASTQGWVDGMWSGEKAQGGHIRTLVLRRPLQGASPDYFTFQPSASALPFIAASGQSGSFSYHGPKSRGGGVLVMVEEGAPVCVCRGARQVITAGVALLLRQWVLWRRKVCAAAISLCVH